MRVHRRFLLRRLLRRQHLLSFDEPSSRQMRFQRQQMRKMRHGTGLHQRRVQLRRYDGLRGLLRERRLRDVRARHVRSRRRRVREVHDNAGMQRARQMRLQPHDLHGLLRCERSLSDVTDIPDVRCRR